MSSSANSFQLAARSRQFSSFLLVVGIMAGPDEFIPKHAIILRNKDEILIPLLTEVLPSTKAFRDAIESLSLEQQSFAKAFRAMQLQSSVFGVCVIQLKPQLERLLNLPSGALTKEIELTEDLLSLFVDYQIPSDLLSYDQNEDVTTAVKLEAVKGHVANVMKVIELKKQQQLQDERLKTDMRAEKFFSQALDDDAEASAAGSSGTYRYTRRRSLQTDIYPMNEKVRFTSPLSAYQSASSPGEATPGSEVLFSLDEDNGSESRDEPPVEPSLLEEDGGSGSQEDSATDFTLIPRQLDVKLEKYDLDGSLRSVILRADEQWTFRSQETLLSPMQSVHYGREDIDIEKKKAFDLLDAISRSGTLPIESSELHVFITVSHCFEKSIMETVIQDNTNPIEKVEKSMLLLASTIYSVSSYALISHNTRTLNRMKAALPELFLAGGDKENGARTT
jgi:hypothetical protein